MKIHDKLYIAGAWTPSLGRRKIEVTNAATEAVIAQVPEGAPEDVALAAQVARSAFDDWSQTPPAQRAQYLGKIAEGLSARADEIAHIITAEVGMPLKLSKRVQAGLPPQVMVSYAKLAGGYPFEESLGKAVVVREPVGVAGCITPWNYPLHQAVAKVAPALAAGCTVVLKPSEVAPLSAFILAEVIDAAGLPAGVFNLVCGTGQTVGEAIACSPDIDMISFTGSTRAGKRVSELAATTVKRVALELGGKSPSIVLEDADFARAIKSTVSSCYLNSGQTCSAYTRLLVPEARYEEAAALAVEAARAFAIGDPFDEKTRLGPLISEAQRERVRGFIRKGVEEGAQLLLGGADQPPGFSKGYFVAPTVFGRVRPDMTIAQQEIFGPVLSIITYKDEADAVRIANGTVYGLAGAVWSGDSERARHIAGRIRAGSVDVNGGGYDIEAPFGGYKQSGYGREFGRYGLEEFLEIKTLQISR